MQTLIISDVHEDMSMLRRIEETLMPQADHVICLGDFWDTFSPQKQAHDAAQWVKDHIHDPKFTILFGNHCCHYAFKHPYFRCSGYSQSTKIIIDSVLTSADWQKFKVYTKVGNYTISHAGFHPETIGFMDTAIVDQALDLAFAGEYHNLWAAGRVRGGGMRFGGPTWLDWNHEFEPMTMPQIVGHTVGKEVRTKSLDGAISYCLDTALRHVLWTDGDTVEIVKL